MENNMKNTIHALILLAMAFNLLPNDCKAETDQNAPVAAEVEAVIQQAFLEKPVELVVVPDHSKKPCCYPLPGELNRQLANCFFIEDIVFIEFYPENDGRMCYYVQTEICIDDGRINIFLEPFENENGEWKLVHNRKVLILYKCTNGKYLILAKVPDKFAHLVENFIRDNFNQ